MPKATEFLKDTYFCSRSFTYIPSFLENPKNATPAMLSYIWSKRMNVACSMFLGFQGAGVYLTLIDDVYGVAVPSDVTQVARFSNKWPSSPKFHNGMKEGTVSRVALAAAGQRGRYVPGASLK
jgi:hypothetical protein